MSLFLYEEEVIPKLVKYNESKGREVLTSYTIGDTYHTLTIYIENKNE
jgi:hypothetical protein